MTAVLEQKSADSFHWKPVATVEEYRAVDEREAAFTLFPKRTRLFEKIGVYEKGDRGGLYIPTSKLKLASLLGAPRITKAMLDSLGADIADTRVVEGNLLLNAGINRMGSLLIGAGGQVYNNANCAIGVGDTATAAAATQTDLLAAVAAGNRYIQMADGTFPTFATQVLTVQSTFATGNGNFAWAEWIISQNTASGAVAATAAALNRKVAALGTKTSAAAWAFTVTITIS